MTESRKDTLLESARRGDEARVEEIIKAEKHLINCQDNYSRTPLLLAAWNNHFQIVKYLIEQGAEVDKVAYGKMTPLTAAASYGRGEIVSYLLEQKANINNVCSKGRTALIYAASSDRDPEKAVRYDDCAKRLLRQGANVNVQDRDGKTAIMHAKLDSLTFDALIEAKADLELKDKSGKTLFAQALLEDDSLTTISKLRDLGVDINQVDRDGNSALDLVLKSKNLMKEKIAILLSPKTPMLDSRHKDRAIAKAMESKSSESFKVLFESGIKPESGTKILAYAYHANMFDAVFSSRTEWKREELIDFDGQSLLARAIQDEKYTIAIALIPFCDVNQKMGNKSPLEIAFEKKNFAFAEQLINACANVNAVHSNGEPLLIRFIRDKTIARLLIHSGADIDCESKLGTTPLIAAVEANKEDLVSLILQKKPRSLNAKNRDGKTALYIATENPSTPNEFNIIANLIAAEANPFIVYAGNLTVFDIAYGQAKEMLSEYRKRLSEKPSIAEPIESSSHSESKVVVEKAKEKELTEPAKPLMNNLFKPAKIIEKEEKPKKPGRACNIL